MAAKNTLLAMAVLSGGGLFLLPAGARAGGEMQSVTEIQQTVTQAQTPGMPAGYAPAPPGPQPYRFCLPYPYNGPGRTPCYPPNGMTHYAPAGYGGGFVYPGYAYAGRSAAGMGPGPFLTGAIVGVTLGAYIF